RGIGQCGIGVEIFDAAATIDLVAEIGEARIDRIKTIKDGEIVSALDMVGRTGDAAVRIDDRNPAELVADLGFNPLQLADGRSIRVSRTGGNVGELALRPGRSERYLAERRLRRGKRKGRVARFRADAGR